VKEATSELDGSDAVVEPVAEVELVKEVVVDLLDGFVVEPVAVVELVTVIEVDLLAEFVVEPVATVDIKLERSRLVVPNAELFVEKAGVTEAALVALIVGESKRTEFERFNLASIVLSSVDRSQSCGDVICCFKARRLSSSLSAYWACSRFAFSSSARQVSVAFLLVGLVGFITYNSSSSSLASVVTDVSLPVSTYFCTAVSASLRFVALI
jgi:hypothetical protein